MSLDAVVGHRRLVTLLSRAIARDTLPPALLLAGPAGIGKKRVALALGQAINCTAPRSSDGLERDACGACASCRRIARGVHPDVVVVAPGDSGSIKLEVVRPVIDQANYRPFEARRRVVIIDEADALVPQAQHALLKTLEEPPSASIFLLVSSLPDALLPTVRSRCPRLRFGPLAPGEVAAALVRDHEYSEVEARAAAVDAEGSVGRALSSKSADLVDARETATRVLQQAARAADPVTRVGTAQGLSPKKGSPMNDRDQLSATLRIMSSVLRDLGLMASQADAAVIANADLRSDLEALSRSYDANRSVRAYAAVDEALAALERNANAKVVANWLVLQL
ncbi:MAG TPA: DNA polymerase III subunit [Vicinamibacterales bacterium]|jgi:DNA polymerase III subunit delta'|nr:DNA polymerase III subunit [Vicinamibacterales bacterium]